MKKNNLNNFIDKWNFNEWAEKYDQVIKESNEIESWMYKDYDRILDKVMEYSEIEKNKNIKIVDIGMGTGNLTLQFLKKEVKIMGIDPSEKMRIIAKDKCGDIPIINGHFLNIPLQDKSVDLVVSSFAFHHLDDEEKIKAIIEMKRILKSGGKIIIADLMFKNKFYEKKIKKILIKKGRNEIVNEIKDEYYGLFDVLKIIFNKMGFEFKGEQLTEFVWIFYAFLR